VAVGGARTAPLGRARKYNYELKAPLAGDNAATALHPDARFSPVRSRPWTRALDRGVSEDDGLLRPPEFPPPVRLVQPRSRQSSSHRIHHSNLPEHMDKNFATMLPLWDILFGTYYHPKKEEWPSTGVAGVKVTSLRQAIIMPFVTWGKMLRDGWQRGWASDQNG